MTKRICAAVCVLLAVILCTAAVFADGETHDEVIVSLYEGNADGWLDNVQGAHLYIDKAAGREALLHEPLDNSLSMKRKFEADLSKYDLKNLYIVADVYIDGEIDETARGTLKIKNGDSADTDNPTDSNQFNFKLTELGLVQGWNRLELCLADATTEGGDDISLADWFCLWMNGNSDYVEIGFGKLDIVNRVAGAAPAAAETPAEAPAEAPAEVQAPAAETEVVTAAPQTSDICVILFAVMTASAVVCGKAKRK